MKTTLKWLTGVVLFIVAGLGIASIYLAPKGTARTNAVFEFAIQPVVILKDEVTLARGEHLSKIWGCVECHGVDFSGKELMPSDNPIAHVTAPNITKGSGGLAPDYGADDGARAIRFGVDPQGRPLFLMSSNDWTRMSDGDVNALIAYMQQVSPVDRNTPEQSLTLLGRVLAGAGKVDLWEAERIDPKAAPNNTLTPAVSVEYGAYLANVCTGCHRPNFQGGPSLMDPKFPAVPALTAGSASSSWSREQFITALTTGKLPDGRQMEALHMPWTAFAHFSPLECDALYAFLQSFER